MLKKFFIALLLIIIIVTTIGCSNDDNSDKVAEISSNPDSEYANTFEDLALGVVFDFNLKLPNADKSWVDIWVEGYSNGKAIEKNPITKLSYGNYPEEVQEGHIGFGIINPSSKGTQLFIYGPGIKGATDNIDDDLLSELGANSWDYAIGSDTISLKSGEEKVLAAYTQNENTIRTYDLSVEEDIDKMIKEDKAVLLLKIQVKEMDKK